MRGARGTIGLLLAAAWAMAACGIVGGGDDPVQVGAVTFAENQIVAEMYAQVLEDAGYSVERRFNYQNREMLQPDIESGEVDVAPEYLASLLTFLDAEAAPAPNAEENVGLLNPLLEESGLELLEPSRADNTNALVVTEGTAHRHGLAAVSDLAGVASDLVFGGPPECPQRTFCLKGLEDVYGLRFKEFKALDAGGPLTLAALQSGEIDVALLFSTSGVIGARGWIVLEDDKNLQSAENITPLVRAEALDDEASKRLDEVSAALTTEIMVDLNARVEVENDDFRAVARSFLMDEGLL